MKRLCISIGVACAAATVCAATYSRIAVDAATLPEGRAFFRETLLERVWDRTPPSDAAGTLTVRFATDPSLEGETAVVNIKDGVAEIRGSRFRALVFGAGLMLRSIRYGVRTFELDDGELRFAPYGKIRIAYFARHFDNWYHWAGADEIRRYVEDLALWGINSFNMQTSYAVVDMAKSTAGDRAIFDAATIAISERIQALDMELTTGGGGNTAPSNMPEKFRAVPNKPTRGADQFNVCPELPGALDYLCSIRSNALDRAKHLPVTALIYWPFDEGGCACEKCHPWGGRGYPKLLETYRDMNAKTFPSVRHYVSTWLFTNDDWALFYKYLEKQDWIDGIIVDSGGEFPRWPLEHPIPRNVPVITFPEISMWGRFPWGGTGANPLPARFDRIYRQCAKIARGFELYSEGIYEDVNKIAITGIYVDPKRTCADVLEDYARYELPGCDPKEFRALCEKLEANYETRREGARKGWRGCVVANYLREEKPEILERRCALAREAGTLADKIDLSIIPSMRRAWRWRIIYLRAKIDEAVFTARDIRPAAAIPLYDELTALYHADHQVTGLYDGTWRGYTCPPYAENATAKKKYNFTSTLPVPEPDFDGRYGEIDVSYAGIPGRGHVQGICASPRAIYLGRTHDIVKADWTGKVIKRVEAHNHTGDLCWWNGRIYSSVADRNERGGKGRIQVYDEDLNLLHDVLTPKTMDGITCIGGVLYIGNGVKPWSGMKGPQTPHRENLVSRYDAVTLEPISGMETIDHGQDTCYGIQNLTTDGERLFARFYVPKGCANTVIYSKDWKPLQTMKLTDDDGRGWLANGMEWLRDDLFLLCRTRNYNNKPVDKDVPLVAELTFWRLTPAGLVNVTRKNAAPKRPQAGTSQHAAVAAAYALRTPEKKDRFADGWEFAKAVYGKDYSAGCPTNVVVFSFAGETAEKTRAIRKAISLLDPGDLVVADGTNVCFYAGDVYGDGRGKSLAVNNAGFVGEWDLVGAWQITRPNIPTKIASAKAFSVLRPLSDPDAKIAGRRAFPKGEGEKIEDERTRAALAAAWAFYLKNECAQYDSIGLVDAATAKKAPGNWSRKNDDMRIEDCTPDKSFFMVCSSYAYEVYNDAFGYHLGEDSKGRLTYNLTQYPPPGILVYKRVKGKDAKTDEEAIAEMRSLLKPGDIIVYAKVQPPPKFSGGHALVYVGKVDGIDTVLHSAGGKYDFTNGCDTVEFEGTIQKNDLDDLLFTKGRPRYVMKYTQVVILRPLMRNDLALTPAGKARAALPRFRYDRRVQGGVFGSVTDGGLLRYSVEVGNFGTEPCDATVRESAPEGADFVAWSAGAQATTNSLVWPLRLAPGEKRTFGWTVRVRKDTPAGTRIVANGGCAGGLPSNSLETEVVARKVSVDDAFRWADRAFAAGAPKPECAVRGWCGGRKATAPTRDGRVRETRSRDLMPGDVVAIWKDGIAAPAGIWVCDGEGMLERAQGKMCRVKESRVAALLAADRFEAFRPARLIAD